jgi:hypothetical protein
VCPRRACAPRTARVRAAGPPSPTAASCASFTSWHSHWARITASVVDVWDELDERKEQIRAARPREHTDAVLQHMLAMMQEMGLEQIT